LTLAAIGILGGTFDPVHNAHLAMARAALGTLRLKRVLFIPTGKPQYRKPAVASGRQRLEMLRLALADDPRLAIDARELQPGASGYTVDTLRALHAEGMDELCLLMGADQYAKLGSWHNPQEVLRLARVAVFARPGIELKEPVDLVPMEPMPISSSDLRARAARGEDLSAFVPAAVANYIARHALYR
jgi:nicotinate-nucleotide adenylyltransferase